MKLRELKPWTFITTWKDKHILMFLWIDWIYARRTDWYGWIVIMWHANQDVSEYWEILDYYHKDEEDEN